MPDAAPSIIGYALGPIHRAWMNHPLRAALVALLFYLVVIGFAGALGILPRHLHSTAIECTNSLGSDPIPGAAKVDADGFIVANWGLLYFFAMPLAAFLMGTYFDVTDNALLSLDHVIKPLGVSEKPFTQFLGERIRQHWSSWIFPLSVAIPLMLTIVADGRDILAPLQSKSVLSSCSHDWSTLGYTVSGAQPPLWYFGFNLLAWTMQLFLGYCGVMALALAGGALGTVFRYGLGGKAITELFRAPSSTPAPERYDPDWVYGKARCGLDKLDTVFLLFFALNLFALVSSAVSIFVNVFWRHHATVGSVLLAAGTMIFIPFSFFWVFVPYFSNFPEDYPQNFLPPPNSHKPNPWPFGSQNFAWGLVIVTASFWIFLLVVILRSVFPGFSDK